jgi:hypothetical protein
MIIEVSNPNFNAGQGSIIGGLTVDETREFERLDELMSYANFVPADDSQSLNERRWLVLYDRHQASAMITYQLRMHRRLGPCEKVSRPVPINLVLCSFDLKMLRFSGRKLPSYRKCSPAAMLFATAGSNLSLLLSLSGRR